MMTNEITTEMLDRKIAWCKQNSFWGNPRAIHRMQDFYFEKTRTSVNESWPELVQKNEKGKFVLFGGYPKDCDKKMIIWELVAKREPQIVWHYTKNNTLKKENFDQSDAYTCALGYMKEKGIW